MHQLEGHKNDVGIYAQRSHTVLNLFGYNHIYLGILRICSCIHNLVPSEMQ